MASHKFYPVSAPNAGVVTYCGSFTTDAGGDIASSDGNNKHVTCTREAEGTYRVTFEQAFNDVLYANFVLLKATELDAYVQLSAMTTTHAECFTMAAATDAAADVASATICYHIDCKNSSV